MPSPVIVALDFELPDQAEALVAQLGDAADHYKVGLQLLTEAGPDLVRRLVAAGKSVFQVRVASPEAAAAAGARYIVIGRSITAAPDPRSAYENAVSRFTTTAV